MAMRQQEIAMARNRRVALDSTWKPPGGQLPGNQMATNRARAENIAGGYESSSSKKIQRYGNKYAAIASPDQMSYAQLRAEDQWIEGIKDGGGGEVPGVVSRRRVMGRNAKAGRNANLDFWRDQFSRYNRSFESMKLVDQGIIDRRRESRKQRLRGETNKKFRRPADTGAGPLDTGTSLTSQVV